MLQEIRADIQELLSHCVFGNLQIFSIDAKGFGSAEKVLVLRGRDIKRLRDEMGWEFVGCGIKISELIIRRILQEIVLFDELFLGSNCRCGCRYELAR